MSENESTAKKDSSVTDITDILDRFKSKRSKKTGQKDNLRQQRGMPKASARNRKFYNEEDDKLWVKYFHGEEPEKQDSIKAKHTDEGNDTGTDIATDTVKGVQHSRKTKRKSKTKKYAKNKTLPTLDSTHTSSEAKVYSIMYRETITKGVSDGYFSVRGLMSDTGLGSPNTVRSALKGLRAKKSIELVGELNNSPLGTRYRIYHPKEIFKTRDREELIIDSHTKKVISVQGKLVENIYSSGVSSAVSQTDTKTVSESVSKFDTATVSRNDTVNQDIPYIRNNINDDSLESSSNIKKKNDVDIGFNHKKYIISLYERYTDNKWNNGTDDDYYDLVKGKTPGIIEAGVISSVLRSAENITSFSSCEGCINEFTQNFPPGYLGYLREKWNEIKETDGNPVYLVVPENSYFREEWLKNYLSNFSGEERKKIKRLAEQFDHYMLTSGAGKEWIKNPTGAFVGLVRGEVNLSLSRDAPTFEERVGGDDEG